LTDDTPENRARAYCHYHLTVEGVLAQTGYYGVQSSFSGGGEAPELPGLVEGFSKVRADEGRHVGFGMAKLKDLVSSGAVPASLLEETVSELLELTQEIVAAAPAEGNAAGLEPDELTAYAAEKHLQRMRQITQADESIPGVEELVEVADP
jgi:ribonucleoside-diphosphate reductase beta chain